MNPSGLQLEPGESAVVSVALDGAMPAAGSYEGILKVQAGGTTLRVPYLYIASDGQPFDIFPLFPAWGEFTGAPGSMWRIVFRVVDAWGLPVSNVPVTFSGTGAGTIDAADAATDLTGKAAADVTLGSATGDQTFTASAGGLQVQFYVTVSP